MQIITSQPVCLFLNLLLSIFLFSVPLAYSAPPLEGFADIVKRVSPAVVHIEEFDAKEKNTPEINKDFEIPFQSEEHYPKFGSGFLVSSAGHIITNKHVIADLQVVLVTLVDNRSFKAEILFIDPEEDLAILKITGQNFPYLKLNVSDNTRPGDFALAIGCPFKSGPIVTSGIISSLGNTMSQSKFNTKYIQTDALITMGNSGGPLLNNKGEVIGVNSAQLSNGGAYSGLGFALSTKVILNSTTFKKFEPIFK